jgi:hypothetical protein
LTETTAPPDRTELVETAGDRDVTCLPVPEVVFGGKVVLLPSPCFLSLSDFAAAIPFDVETAGG